MSQRNVEAVIGRLVTDEGLRGRFTGAPAAALRDLMESGIELNECEVRALAAIDPAALERFAGTLHPGIQKVALQRVALQGGRS